MRKILSFFIVSLMTFGVFAQNSIVDLRINADIPQDYKVIKATEWPVDQPSYRETIKSEWYSFTTALDFYLGGTMRYFTNAIFPDTFVQRINSDATKSYVKWHSMGMVFDPRDDMWPLSNYDQLEINQPYKVDSIAFRYLYEKYNDNAIKDKLVVQFFNSDKVAPWTMGQEPFGTVDFDTLTLSGVDYSKQVVYDLEYKDTATWASGQYKWMSFPVDIDIPKSTRPIFATTFTFKPSYSYKFNDTLSNLDTAQSMLPYKKLNNFWHQMFYDPASTALTSYNNGLVMNYETRYHKLTGGIAALNGKYLPGTAFTSAYYPYVIFKITYDNDWIAINENNVNFKVGQVYPNPVSNIAKLAVNLENAATVKIDFINALGQSTIAMDNEMVNAGEHIYELNTTNLTPGIYTVRVSVDGFSSTQNMIVK